MDFPSAITVPNQFDEWYETIAFTNPDLGKTSWTKYQAREWYEEEIRILEREYQSTIRFYEKNIQPYQYEYIQTLANRTPGPLPRIKTRVYNLTEYYEKYPLVPSTVWRRSLSHVDQGMKYGMEKADECQEGDTILNNYYIYRHDPWNDQDVQYITYSYLKKIDGKMMRLEDQCTLDEFDWSRFTFTTT